MSATDRSDKALAEANARFAELVDSGEVFVRPTLEPTTVEDIKEMP